MSKFENEVKKCLRKMQKGDKAQVGELYNLTANHLRTLVVSSLIDASHVDDVLADVFFDIMQNIHAFDFQKSEFRQICAIADRKVADYNALDAEIGESPKADDSAQDRKNNAAQVNIFAAVKDLSDLDRAILFDVFYKCLSLMEVATKHGVTEAKVREVIDAVYMKTHD